MSTTLNDVTVPDVVADAFRTRPFLTTPELAGLLGMNRETIIDYVARGQLPWRQKGQGRKSLHRIYSLEDVRILLLNLQRQSQQGNRLCLSNERNQESGAAILPFMARTSSDGARAKTGISSSRPVESNIEGLATPRTSGRQKRSPPKLKPKRKSKHVRIERPDLAR